MFDNIFDIDNDTLDYVIKSNFIGALMYKKDKPFIHILFSSGYKSIYKLVINDDNCLETYECNALGEKIGDCFTLYTFH